MIPPDLLARAREAFEDADTGWQQGFEDAISVLSAAWPEADGRRLSTDLTEEQWTRFREHLSKRGWLAPAESDNMRDIRAAFRAALSPPSAPAADVRIVRVAVAECPDDGERRYYEIVGDDEARVWHRLQAAGFWTRLCIAEIPVPVRDVPTVRASVEAPDA